MDDWTSVLPILAKFNGIDELTQFTKSLKTAFTHVPGMGFAEINTLNFLTNVIELKV